MKISQTVTFENPAKILPGASVPVKSSKVSAISTDTPMGIGCATSATMVATKIANKWACAAVRPSTGMK